MLGLVASWGDRNAPIAWNTSGRVRCCQSVSEFRNDQHRAGSQKKYQHDLPERSLVEAAEQFQAKPGADQQRGQAEDKKLDSLAGYCAAGADPECADQEDGNGNRLKHRALLVLWPAAQSAPDDDENSREAGDAAKHAVEKSHSRIRG